MPNLHVLTKMIDRIRAFLVVVEEGSVKRAARPMPALIQTRLLETSANVTTEVQGALNEAARLRAECQAQMLSHFYEVSRTMSPDQGKRYLTWVRSKTLAGAAAQPVA